MAKWLSVRLQTKWFWVQVQLQSLKLQISRLLRAKSSLSFRIQECGFTLKCVSDMTRTYSQHLFIFVIISSTYYIIYCLLCLCHFVFLLELDINKYVFGTSRAFDNDQSNTCCFLLSEEIFPAFLRH